MLRQIQHWLTAVVVSLFMGIFLTSHAIAAPYAAVVMDARSGQILYARNADTRLHPASLTKMMTLYIVFQEIEKGNLTLDTKVRVSRNAANEPPSRLGLKAGQRIALKYLIRAAAVKSANDAATAMGDYIGGSEAAFARRMTATARRLGMKHTTFKNANGLTRKGHLSTARDMTILGRHLFYDFPQYYNLFSRRSTDAKLRTVYNTNRKLLKSYRGLDGIKTGYTDASGFNLVASARHGNKRVIATVFGGRTSTSRNAKIAQLLDLGFNRVNTRLAEQKPKKDILRTTVQLATIKPKFIKVAVSGAVRKSPIPRMRQTPAPVQVATVDKTVIESAIIKAVSEEAESGPQTTKPLMRTTDVVTVALVAPKPEITEPRIVSRKSTSGREWAVQLGAFSTKFEAEKILLKTELSNLGPLEDAERRISRTTVGSARYYRARFIGLSQVDANITCSRLRARSLVCVPVSPGS